MLLSASPAAAVTDNPFAAIFLPRNLNRCAGQVPHCQGQAATIL